MGQSKVSPLQVVSYAANVFVFVTVVAALYLAQDVFIPLTLSMMLAFLLAPIADRLEDWGLRRVPAVLVLGVLAFSIIGGFLWVVGREATKLASNIPQYQAEIVHKVEGFSTFGSGTSQRLTKFVTAVSDALRGNKRPVRPAGPAVTGPIDDLDAKSSQVVTDQAYEPTGSADAQPDEPGNSDELGSPGNPIHTVQASNSNSPMGTALETATVVLNPLTNVGLVIVFTIFMLLSRDDLRDRLIRVLSGGRYIVTTKAIDEASRRISSYILAQTIVNSLYGLCIGFGLWLIGVTLGGEQGFPNFALWGLLCTVMRFVPYVGPILAGAFPVALSLIVFPGFSVFLATASLFTAIELLSNNVLEPWLYGSRTGMSPMAVIVAAVFWTWMWGPVGLLLAVPLTASLIVMGKYVPQLAPLTVLLGDKSPLPPHVSFYQRILAEDMSRGEKIVQAGIAESDLETWSDEVLLPTIRRIRRDRANEELSAPREHHLMQLITGMIDDQMVKSTEQANDSAKAQAKSASKNQSAVETSERIDEVASPALASHRTVARANSDVVAVVDEVVASTVIATRHHKPVDLGLEMGQEIGQVEGQEAGLEGSTQAEPIAVMGCAAHHESEELVLKVLSYSLDQDNIAMRWTDTKALPSDVEAWVEAQQPAVIVIAIMPPDGFIQAKYLCQQLKQCSPKSQIVVAYFGKLRSYDAILVKFRAAGASFFATSLNQTRSQVTNALKRTKKGSGLFFR